jgi:hypothetical protein
VGVSFDANQAEDGGTGDPGDPSGRRSDLATRPVGGGAW